MVAPNDRLKMQQDTERLIEQTFMPEVLEKTRQLFARYQRIAKVSHDKNPMDFIDHINATMLLGNSVMINAITKKENELGI